MTGSLLDIRDEVTEAKNFLGCLVLACSSHRFGGDERAALCAVGDAARAKLEAVATALDELTSGQVSGEAGDEPSSATEGR